MLYFHYGGEGAIMTTDEWLRLIGILLPMIFGTGGIYLWRKDKYDVRKAKAEASEKEAQAKKLLAEAKTLEETTNEDKYSRLEKRLLERDNTIEKMGKAIKEFEQKELDLKITGVTEAIIENIIERRKVAPDDLAKSWEEPDAVLIRKIESILGRKLDIPAN
jgi:hypothetical protein